MQKEEKKSAGILASLKGSPKLVAVIALIVIGVALMFFGGGSTKKGDQPVTASTREATLEEYAEALESDIRELCAGVRGVGSIRVAVSFSSDFEYVYAKNSSEHSDGRAESSYLTVGNGSSEGTVFLTRLPPKIGGVGIVCSGGGDVRVQHELIRLVSAAYGVSSNRIYVSEAKKE